MSCSQLKSIPSTRLDSRQGSSRSQVHDQQVLGAVHKVLHGEAQAGHLRLSEAFIQSVFELKLWKGRESERIYRTTAHQFPQHLFQFIENTREHMDCKLVTSGEELIKWASNPRYITFKQVSKDLCTVFLRRRSVQMRQVRL